MTQFLAGAVLALVMAAWVVYRACKDKGLLLPGVILSGTYVYAADLAKAGMLAGGVIAVIMIIVMACLLVNNDK